MNNYINEIILSGKILSLVINEKYIVPVEKYNPIKSLRKQGM